MLLRRPQKLGVARLRVLRREQSRQRDTRVADDGDVGVIVAIDDGGVRVDVDQARQLQRPVAGCVALKARADGDHELGRGERLAKFRQRRQRTHRERVILRNRAPPVSRREHRCVERFGEALQLRRCVAADHAAARPDHASRRLADQSQPHPQSPRNRQLSATRAGAATVDVVDLLVLQIDRNLDRAGLRPRRARVAGDPQNHLRNLGGAMHLFGAARDRAQHLELTLRLVQKAFALAEVRRVDLARQHQHRR